MPKRTNTDESPEVETKLDYAPATIIKHETTTETDIVETPDQLEEKKNRLRSFYASNFKSEQDFEYFCMLPLAPSQRREFFEKVRDREEALAKK